MAWNFENAHLVVGKLFSVFYFFRTFVHVTVVVLFVPVSNEASFFAPMDFYLNVSGCKRLLRLDVNLAVDSVAWFIKGKLSLNLNFSFGEVTSRVAE